MSTSPDRVGASDLPLRFGRYTLLALLGEGGMGRVFEARLEGPSGFRKSVAPRTAAVRPGSAPARPRSTARAAR